MANGFELFRPGKRNGVHYVVHGPINTPSGRIAQIVTVWLVETGPNVPRLVTAYPGSPEGADLDMARSLKEHETVVLLHDDDEHGLKAGDVGAIVTVYEQHDVYDVEFARADGRPIAILTLESNKIRPLGGDDLLHVRRIDGQRVRV